MDPTLAFSLSALLNVLGFGAILFITRQGKGEGRQQLQGETLASVRTEIRQMQDVRSSEVSALRADRDKEILALRTEIQTEKNGTDRRFLEMDGRFERHLTQVDTRLDQKRQTMEEFGKNLSRLETIVENLAEQVKLLVARDERGRSAPAAPEPNQDLAMLRAFAMLQNLGVDIGKISAARSSL